MSLIPRPKAKLPGPPEFCVLIAGSWTAPYSTGPADWQPVAVAGEPSHDRRNDRRRIRNNRSCWASLPFFVVPILPDTLRPVGRWVTDIQIIRWCAMND